MHQKPNDRLKGQSCIVTGASSGIGQQVAIAMARDGANVVVNWYSDKEGMQHTVREIEKTEPSNSVFDFQADVSKEEEVQAMFDKTIETFGTVDILVNNAGLQQDAAFHEMTLKQWNRVIDVNLTGQFLCARAAVREFLRRGEVDYSCAIGKIICMSSVHEIIPWAGHVNYAASKGGVMLMMKSIAQEYGAKGIRVNSIAPGAIKTDINQDAWSSPESREELLKLIPYNRIGEPSDIGSVAAWLASDESDYIHGTTIVVDGGMLLYPGFIGNG